MQIKPNSVVTVSYELRIKDEKNELYLIESTEDKEPLLYLHGIGGMIPGFESNLNGLVVGDLFDFVIDPQNGYGDIDEESIVQIPLDVFDDPEGRFSYKDLKVGAMVPMTDSDGNQLRGKVVEITDTNILMDFNHPLAGKELFFKGKVESIRPATSDEIAHGHAHGAGGHHH